MLPPLRDILDPREVPDPPFENSVWIPYSELAERLSELPPKGGILKVAQCGEAGITVGFLRNGGRSVEVVSANTGVSTPGRLWSPSEWLQAVWPPEAKSAVDLGCGSGRDLAYLSSLGIRVVGVERLAEAALNARVLVKRYTGREVPIEVADFDVWDPNEKFDVAVALMAVPLPLFQLPVRWIVLEAYAHDAAKPADARRRTPEETPSGWRTLKSERQGDRIRALYERI